MHKVHASLSEWSTSSPSSCSFLFSLFCFHVFSLLLLLSIIGSVLVACWGRASNTGLRCLRRAPLGAPPISRATAEQSWHRRARRLRQASRAVIAVALAQRVLAAHHGGGMPLRASSKKTGDSSGDVLPGPKSPVWGCSTCGETANCASRLKCRGCGKPASQSTADKARSAARRVQASDAAAGNEANAKDQALQKKDLELKRLREELRKARAGVERSADRDAAATAADAVDSDDLGAAVQQARDKLKKVQSLPTEVRDLVAGGYDECVARLQHELDAAQAERRAAHPLKKRLESAELHKARMDKKLAESRAALLEQEKQLAALQERMALQRDAVGECEMAVRKATAEVAELATKFASERALDGASGSAETAPADGAAAALAAARRLRRDCFRKREMGGARKGLRGPAHAAACARGSGASRRPRHQ